MNPSLSCRIFIALWLACGLRLTDSVIAEEPQTGTFSGVIKFEGEIPDLPPLLKKSDPNTKDAAVCAASAIPDESLVVDQKSRGIANVFVYLRQRPENLAEEDEQHTLKPVTLEKKGCRYVPHAMIVRTDQELKVVSRDEIAHNDHFYPVNNTPHGMLVPPSAEAVQHQFDRPEIVPINVRCDIHPWMKAWVLIVDHPFAAVTGKNGKFKIEGLPPGEYEFRIWQEKAGWLEKKYQVKIKAGETTEANLNYTGEAFED